MGKPGGRHFAALARQPLPARRGWLRSVLLLPLLLAATRSAAAAPPPPPPGYTVSYSQLDRVLAARFPRRLAAGGLLQLTLGQPVLRPLPALNRLAARLPVSAGGPALARSADGDFELDFGLRYEPGDRSLRAHDLRVRSLQITGLPAPYPELLEAVGQALADRSLGEVVLHRLRPEELALADVMGLEPDTVTVTAAGLVIGFAPRSGR